MSSYTDDQIARITADLHPTTILPRQQTTACPLSERIAHYATPGIGIAVIEGGQVVWERGFGTRVGGRADPVDADTLFQAGSISKPVFALGAMRLVEQGRIALDDDIQQYLRSWRVPSNGGWTPRITLRQLLSHTAGTSIHGFPGYPASGPWPTLAQVLDGVPPANTFPVIVDLIPGLQFRYSGGGTTIAQVAVMDVLGAPFPEIMNELVFDPLALKNSTYAQPLPADWAARSATAHPWNGVPTPGRCHIYPEMAAAGLWTTAGDLARIGCAFLGALSGESASLGLSAAAAAEMLKPQLPTDLEGGDFVGLGWHCSGKGSAFHCFHGGWDEGFIAGLWLYPALGKGAAIMLNSNQGSPLLNEVKEAIGREYDWPKPEQESVVASMPVAAEGRYETEQGLVCDVTSDGAGIILRLTQQPPLAFVHKGSGFASDCVNATLEFLPSHEAPTALVLTQFGRGFRFEKKQH
jgi:CubicO group peptidase (beta-lactamase class C family)